MLWVLLYRLYSCITRVEWLTNEEDWPCVQLAFTCDLWKSATNKEHFTCMVHRLREKVGGGLELKQ